jgi:glycosyltransferase involved in cell wall biosynthesis
MAWNWATNIARHCNVHVITEIEFKEQILSALPDLQQRDNMSFHFVDIGSDRIRRMCWNQGDWRFYWHYRKWQLDALDKAREIIAHHKIDLLHQLNMIGYREPGFLWRIDGIPLVWGPVGGFGRIPASFVRQYPVAERIRQSVKNLINSYQFRAPRVQAAIAKSAAILAANSVAYETMVRFKDDGVYLMNETASYEPPDLPALSKGPGLRLCWVGRNLPGKALFLAVEVMQQLRDKDVKLVVVGVAEDEVPASFATDNIEYRGMVSHAEAMEQMRLSDAMLFTSLFEGTPHVVLESLHLGVPVICHDACGQGDVVDQRCGIKVPLESPEVSVHEFVSAIDSLMQDRVQLSGLASGALERARELTWGERADQVIGIYEQVLDSS